MDHLECNHILYDLQYGFRCNRSCESQLISLINGLTKCYDAGKQSDLICMDISKGFNTDPHNRLKLKLQWYGITGTTFQWISSFSMRCQLYKQISSINDAVSLQSDLESLQCWGEKWLLKFNVSKCHVLKITRATVHKIEYNYQLHNTSS